MVTAYRAMASSLVNTDNPKLAVNPFKLCVNRPVLKEKQCVSPYFIGYPSWFPPRNFSRLHVMTFE